MELREAEALGVLDDHHRRLGHVDADFDDGRGHEDRDFAGGEALHRRIALLAGKAPVHEAGLAGKALREVGMALGRRGEVGFNRFLDQRADPIDTRAFADRAADRGIHVVEALQWQHARVDRLAIGGLLVEAG